jgi:hypothetical protein
MREKSEIKKLSQNRSRGFRRISDRRRVRTRFIASKKMPNRFWRLGTYFAQRWREDKLRFDETNRAALLCAFALILVENFLPQAKVLRRRFDVFVHVNVFQRAFETQLHRRAELNAFAVAL